VVSGENSYKLLMSELLVMFWDTGWLRYWTLQPDRVGNDRPVVVRLVIWVLGSSNSRWWFFRDLMTRWFQVTAPGGPRKLYLKTDGIVTWNTLFVVKAYKIRLRRSDRIRG
jgi:hypothetical protein